MTPPRRWWDDVDLVANVSILFAEAPFDERPALARRHGFDRIESWWPFESLAPTGDERERFAASIQVAGQRLHLLNTYAGDMAAGDRGLASLPDRADAFAANLAQTVSIATQLGCSNIHVMLGNRVGRNDDEIEPVALAALERATRLADDSGVTVLLEVLNDTDNPDYVLTSLDRAIDWIRTTRERTGTDAIALLFDAYHLTMLGEDLADACDRAAGLIGHVQIADVPGRGAPGTGRIDFGALVGRLRHVGYRGPLALEYRPEPDDPFGWMR